MKQTIYYPEYTADNIEKYRRLLPPKRHIDQSIVYMEMWYNGADYTTELHLDERDERQYMVPFESRTEQSVALNSTGLHSHDFYEMFVVLTGELDIRMGSTIRAFRPGECCILNKNVIHVELFRPNAKLLYIGLADAFFAELNRVSGGLSGPRGPIADFFTRNLGHEDALKSEYLLFTPKTEMSVAPIMQDVALRLRQRHASSPLFIYADVIEIFETLSNAVLYEGSCVELVEYPIESISEIIRSMIEESDGMITVREISRRLNYNPSYISRILKKYTGHTTKEYCQICQMNRLRRRILESEESISAILKQLGYENKTQIYRVFKRIYGCTPNEYRNKAEKSEGVLKIEDPAARYRNL